MSGLLSDLSFEDLGHKAEGKSAGFTHGYYLSDLGQYPVISVTILGYEIDSIGFPLLMERLKQFEQHVEINRAIYESRKKVSE